jgi:isopentenyldiphosphate isomerase
MMQNNDRMLACVDEYCEPTGMSVDRNVHYSDQNSGTFVCGIAYWIFDSEGMLLLIKRTAGKEHAPGRISAPSRHLYPNQDSHFVGVEKEIGIALNKDNFATSHTLSIVGSIPDKQMLVKHCVMRITDAGKAALKCNDAEASTHFFETWEIAQKRFLLQDDVVGAYRFHGSDEKQAVLAKLNECVELISQGEF